MKLADDVWNSIYGAWLSVLIYRKKEGGYGIVAISGKKKIYESSFRGYIYTDFNSILKRSSEGVRGVGIDE